MNSAKMAERRRIAHNLYREQVNTVEQRKRDTILRQLAEQREAETMLDRTKKEYVMSGTSVMVLVLPYCD